MATVYRTGHVISTMKKWHSKKTGKKKDWQNVWNVNRGCLWANFFFFFTLFLHFQIFSYWNIVDLLCCISFRCRAKWFSCMYIIYIIYIFFFSLFSYRLLQSIEYSSLHYTVGLCWLSILYTVVCICYSQTPNLSLPPRLFPFVTIRSFSMSVSLFLFCK